MQWFERHGSAETQAPSGAVINWRWHIQGCFCFLHYYQPVTNQLCYDRDPDIRQTSCPKCTRTSFYLNNLDLLPPTHKFSFRHLKQVIQEFHRKYVLVPTDKASNNVVVV